MIKKKVSFIFVFLLCVKLASSQYYSTGQDPASAKWKQINTENFQVIYQKEFTEQAQYIAKTLEFYYLKVGYSLNHKPRKISVIIHNQTVLSNGYVAWAPKRVELYPTIDPETYPDPWIKHLCIHELRHVVQLDKLNQGITRILSLVFGQQYTGLVAGQMPMWYYEGDAVGMETALSNFGRGRLPRFQRGIKTHLLSDDKTYSFDKMLFGSYKDYVPNHYELGYQLVSFARKKYGIQVWDKVEDHVAKNSYTLLPTTWAFYKGLKKNYGLTQKELYNQTIEFLDSLWSNEKKQEITPDFFQNYEIDDYENYLNPIIIDENRILSLKKGISHIPQFVILNREKEKILFEPGYVISDDYSYAKDFLVWAEYKPDLRWTNREYTSIKILNIRTKKQEVLIEKSRYFSPDISKTQNKIVVVEVDKTNVSSLVVLDVFSGKIIQKVPTRDSNFISRPKWSSDEKSVYVIELTSEGKQIAEYNFALNKWITVFKLKNGDIERILPHKNKIYFHSTLNGTDNVYVFDKTDKKIFQLSSSKYGISGFDLYANGNEIITNEYTSQGFRIATIPYERAVWKPVDINEKYNYTFADVLSKQESAFEDAESIQESDFVEKPYRKILNPFYFHSWIPFYFDYSDISVSESMRNPELISQNLFPGLMLISQNKLSTTESILSYSYKNGNHSVSSSIVFKGKYPVFSLNANYGEEQEILASNEAPAVNVKPAYSYNIDAYVPLNLSKGKYVKGIRPYISFKHTENLYYYPGKYYYLKGMNYVNTNLYLYSYQRMSERDIYPPFGISLNIGLYNTPFEKELLGHIFNSNTNIYFPGGKNKAFKLDLGYQYQKVNKYYFNSLFRFPRGIQKNITDRLVKIYSDYVFPIYYPDWNLGSFIYIKRFKGNLYYDYAQNAIKVYYIDSDQFIWWRQNMYSVGGELSMDYHLLRTMFPLNTGVRFGYVLSESRAFVELIFGIDLFNF